MKCIIVDDEPKARLTLEKWLEIQCNTIEVVASCGGLNLARQNILNYSPDLVFLDLQLINESGFDLVCNMKNRDFAVIITTAYQEYAVKAFDLNIQDYLLKPINPERLSFAIDKAASFLTSFKDSEKAAEKPEIQILPHNGKVLVPTSEGFELLEVDEILRVESQGNYCKLFHTSEKEILFSKNLKPIENLLKSHSFYRVHNLHLINMKHIQKVLKTDGGIAVMKDGTKIEISRRKWNKFIEYLSSTAR